MTSDPWPLSCWVGRREGCMGVEEKCSKKCQQKCIQMTSDPYPYPPWKFWLHLDPYSPHKLKITSTTLNIARHNADKHSCRTMFPHHFLNQFPISIFCNNFPQHLLHIFCVRFSTGFCATFCRIYCIELFMLESDWLASSDPIWIINSIQSLHWETDVFAKALLPDQWLLRIATDDHCWLSIICNEQYTSKYIPYCQPLNEWLLSDIILNHKIHFKL